MHPMDHGSFPLCVRLTSVYDCNSLTGLQLLRHRAGCVTGRYIRVLCIINYLVSPVYRRQKSCFVYFLSWFDVLWVPTVLCPSARCLARFNACLYRCMVFPRLWPVLLVCKPILISWPNDLIVCCLFSPHTRLGLSAYFSVIISWFVCSSLQC